MPELLIMRHAKSDWSSDTGRDHDRPLAPRGVKAAKRMGRMLGAAGFEPDHVLCSSALRARTTAEIAAQAGAWACPIEVVGSLYGISAHGVLEHFSAIPPTAEIALLVGHEPTMSELVALLGGGRVHMVTAAVACLSLGVTSWSSLREGCAGLRFLITPRLLRATP